MTATSGAVYGTAAVTVTPPPPFSAKYDFGTATSPVQTGYTQVTENTKFSSTLGYGWKSGTIVSRDRGIGSNLDRDFNFTTNGTFAVNLPNGNYQVNMDLGDKGPYLHDDMGIFLQGAQVDEVTTAASQVVSKSYTVNVVNGQLDLLLKDLGGVDPNVCIESLSITTLPPSYLPMIRMSACRVDRGDGHEHVFKLGPCALDFTK